MPEERWAWVSTAFESYQQKETGAIRNFIAQGHTTVQKAKQKRDELLDTTDRIVSTGQVHLSMTLDRGWAEAWRLTDTYPGPAVGAATAAFIGVAGWAPRRTLLFSCAAAYALRRSIATQHGEQLANASGKASDFCRWALSRLLFVCHCE